MNSHELKVVTQTILDVYHDFIKKILGDSRERTPENVLFELEQKRNEIGNPHFWDLPQRRTLHHLENVISFLRLFGVQTCQRKEERGFNSAS